MIDSIAFSIFGIDIAWYGICIALGMLGAIWICTKTCKYYSWTPDDIFDVALFGIPAAIVGARIYYVVFEWKQQYANDILSIFNLRQGGLGIIGGIIGGVLAGAIYCKVKKKNFIELLDIVMPTIAFGQFMGRWGNFFNQEAYGPIITNPSFQWFPFAVFIEQTNTYHNALFFYESIWCLFICVFLLMMRKKFKYLGDVSVMYVLLYSFERMLIEGMRVDSLYLGSFRVTQVLMAVLFVASIIYLLVRYIKYKDSPVTNVANPNYFKQL